MKKEEVPQDDANLLEGKTKVLRYATDENGNYLKVSTVGWEPENVALEQAWEIISLKIHEARERCERGLVSPIAYYMEKNQMTIELLSSYTGFWQWTIKRHLKPSIFNTLPNEKLLRYTKIFNITIEELKNIKG